MRTSQAVEAIQAALLETAPFLTVRDVQSEGGFITFFLRLQNEAFSERWLVLVEAILREEFKYPECAFNISRRYLYLPGGPKEFGYMWQVAVWASDWSVAEAVLMNVKAQTQKQERKPITITQAPMRARKGRNAAPTGGAIPGEGGRGARLGVK